MDQVTLNISTILISGIGVFTVLTKFNVRGINKAFWGESPYLIKKGIIENVMNYIFSSFALIGLALQAIKEICGPVIPERSHNIFYYSVVLTVGLFVVGSAVWVLTKIGERFARRIWLPKLIANQREVFQFARFVIEHDGWNESQWRDKDRIEPNITKEHQKRNYEAASKGLNQVEDLLEIAGEAPNLNFRLNRVKRFFEGKNEHVR